MQSGTLKTCSFPNCTLEAWTKSPDGSCALHERTIEDEQEFKKAIHRVNRLPRDEQGKVLDRIFPLRSIYGLKAPGVSAGMQVWEDFFLWESELGKLELRAGGQGKRRIKFINCHIKELRIEISTNAEITFDNGTCGKFETVTWADVFPDTIIEVNINGSTLDNFRHDNHYGDENNLKSATFDRCALGGVPDSRVFYCLEGMKFNQCLLSGRFVVALPTPINKGQITFMGCDFQGDIDFNYFPMKAVNCVFSGRIRRIDFSKAILDESVFEQVRVLSARWGPRYLIQAEQENLEWRESIYRQLKGICTNQGELDIAAELHLHAMRIMRRRVKVDLKGETSTLRREVWQYLKRKPHIQLYQPATYPDLDPQEGWEKVVDGHFAQRPHPLKLAKKLLPNIFRNAVSYAQLSLQDILYGFGVRPSRLILWTVFVIVVTALLDSALISLGLGGINYGQTPLSSNNFWALLYYSGVTITTLGYGDFVPTGWVRLLAVGEALCGAFLIALFVVTFVKKYGN